MSIEWDTFFYYGQGDLSEEIKQDVLNGVVTGKNKLFYNRSDSAGVSDFENAPTSLAITIGLRFAITKWLAYRNTYTGTGTNGTKERRVATSQDEIQVNSDNKGNIDIDIFYIEFANFNQNRTLPVQIGV